jgi:hypothetical protein
MSGWVKIIYYFPFLLLTCPFRHLLLMYANVCAFSPFVSSYILMLLFCWRAGTWVTLCIPWSVLVCRVLVPVRGAV